MIASSTIANDSRSCRVAWPLLAIVVASALPAGAAEPFADRLATLASQAEQVGLLTPAATARQWIIPRHPGRQYLFLPAASEPAPAKEKLAAPLVPEFYAKFRSIRAEQADVLMTAAREALEAKQPARAYQLVHEAFHENPDQAEARRILGYVKTASGGWTLPGAGSLAAQKPRVDLPKLGWPAGSYWRLETPHFAIVTNHSAREALELGRQLEDLHALWRQIFFRYWSTPEALAARFAGGNEPLARPRPRMNVVLLKSREEYLAQLAPSVKQIELTVGIYLDQQRTAFFYAGDTSVYPTWHHEATHQLFQEAVPDVTEHPGQARNFWIIEGAALYMESLARHDGYWTCGGCEAERLQLARYRALTGDFFLPLAELVTLSREQIQASPDIRKLYSHAAGITHFLIDGEGGEHRKAIVDLLTAVYRGEDAADTLSKTTGMSYPELDRQYRQFLNVTDDDLAGIPDVSRLKNLSLGKTSITDRGLAHLAGATKLEWLDLSLTNVTDDGLKSIANLTSLKQLFLEGTKVTDASLPLIGGLKQLEELDLSKLAITDSGLAGIAPLKNLQSLYLTASPVTDTGLDHLRTLKKLEMLDTTGTNITPAALKSLQTTLPKLKPAD